MRLLLLVILVLIVYGTLYPFEFDFAYKPANPFLVLIHSWPRRFDRFTISDTITNVLLYIPLGFAATLAFGRRWWAALMLGAALSAGVEMLQVYDATRFCSLLDLTTNTLGTAVGAVLALAMPRHEFRHVLTRETTGPAIVAACWVAHLFYPFVPRLRRGQLLATWGSFVNQPISPIEIAANAAEWFALALLLKAIFGRMRTSWLALALLSLPIRFFLATRNLAPAEVIGGAAAVVLWAVIPEQRKSRFALGLLASAILLRELEPFDFSPIPQPFSWLPFADTLEGDRVPSTVIILRKAFDYGALVWLARGFGLVRSGLIVAMALAVTEWVQRYVPGRQPEITDAVVALILTGLLVWSQRR